MKLTGYRGYSWEADYYYAGVPVSPVLTGSVQPNILYRPGNTPVFGTGTVSEMTIPVEFVYNGSETYERAWQTLLSNLRPLDTKPATLFGQLNDGTIVRTEALLIVPQQFDNEVNTLTVSFVSVDGKWQSDSPSTATDTFTTTPEKALRCAIVGTKPTSATVRLKPTTSPTSGWTYRRRYRLTNALTTSVSNYPWALDLGDTSSLVSGGKALSSGNDVRVLIGGLEVQRTLVDWNVSGTSTLCWVVIPTIGASGTLTIEVIYGNSAAGAPPTLAYPNLPAFNITTTGANRSTNAQWRYDVDTVAANAGKGGWYINESSMFPSFYDSSVPGAWQPAKTYSTSTTDDFLQPTASEYTDTLTYYMGRFSASRGKYGSLADRELKQFDGVTLANPLGITSVYAQLIFRNQTLTSTDTLTVGKYVVCYRNAPGQPWQIIQSSTATYDTATTLTAATYTPASTVKEIGFAVWPANATGVPATATAGRVSSCSWGNVLRVNIASTNITQSTVQAETAVYEVRGRLRIDRDGSDGVISHDVRLGNHSEATGAETPHLLVELNQQVEVNGEQRQIRIKNSGNTAVVETPSSGVVNYEAQFIDINGDTSTGVAGSVLQLRPETNSYVTNPSFASDANNWTRISATAGITAAALARDTSVFSTTPASGRMTISASTAASGSSVVDLSSNYISLGSIQRISVAATVRTTNANLVPRLVIYWYDSTPTLLSTSTQDTWTPATNTWYRRVFAATKPELATQARVGLATITGASSATGSTYIDTVTVLGNDIQVAESSGGSLTVVADWIERYG